MKNALALAEGQLTEKAIVNANRSCYRCHRPSRIFVMLVASLLLPTVLALSAGPSPEAMAYPDPEQAVTLPGVVVEAESESVDFVQKPFLPDVQGEKINAGKKTTLIDLDALPKINASNYRLALIQTPGLILSEESTPLLSIGYRGLEPHRSQYTQVLADGIPIHAEHFGYPEAYYVPPLDTVDRIEFVRGGGSLMYGPQPGGALNYVTHRPRTDISFGAGTSNTFGADNAWNSFTYVDGTQDRIGYYGYFNHRESDGFRTANSDIKLNAGYLKLALDAEGTSRWFLTLESYREEHGEPGGLSLGTTANDVNYLVNPDAASRLFDRFKLSRDAATLTLEHDLQAGQLSARAWVSDYTRYSRRQRGGGFGIRPTGAIAATNDIESQEFNTFGLEARYRRDWGNSALGHVFTIGAQYFDSDSPRVDIRGASANATTGVLRLAAQRDTQYLPVFAENLFRFGAWSITPGVRLETYRQAVETRFVNPAASTRSREIDDSIALFGLGVAYDFSDATRGYFNVSESYRPVLFTEAVPNSTTTFVAGDLAEGSSWQSDLGFRAQPSQGLVLDASLFYMQFEDKIGGAGTASDPLRNIGEISYRGLEASLQYDFLATSDPSANTPQLNALLNVTLLDAEITQDANPLRVGNAPQYAPDYLLRTGLIYSPGEGRKLALLGTLVDESFADDANTAARFMPSYQVWDFTGEWRIANSGFSVLAGVNNLFDKQYYSRIRNDGIDPAPGRNYYVGFRAEL